MTPAETDEAIKVMTAYSEGGAVQCRLRGYDYVTEGWADDTSPTWNLSALEYRIKPTDIEAHLEKKKS